jgi:hypothetical protein
MFGVIVFAGISFAVAVVVTMLYIMTRKFELRDEARPGRVFVIWLIIALVGPFLFEEALTRTVGKSMKTVVTDAYDSADFDGPMLYYKVTFYTGSKAKVLAVGEEKQSWGGMDHPVVSMNLIRKGNKWKVDTYKVVLSERLDKDGIVYPPLW